MSKTERTAAEVYAEREQDIAAILEWIETELETHRERRGKTEGDWGHVGDLGHVRDELKNVLSFLSGASSDEIDHNLADLHK
jgi:hypothetical protein